MSHVKVSATFTFADPPKGYLGVRSESWHFGKKPQRPIVVAAHMVEEFLNFWMATMLPTDAETNAEIDALAKHIAGLRIETKQVTL